MGKKVLRNIVEAVQFAIGVTNLATGLLNPPQNQIDKVYDIVSSHYEVTQSQQSAIKNTIRQELVSRAEKSKKK